MATFDEYKAKAEHALESLHTQLDELRVQADLAQAEARDRFEAAIDVLRHRQAQLKADLERAKAESGSTWQALAKQLEAGVDEAGDAFAKLATEIDAALGIDEDEHAAKTRIANARSEVPLGERVKFFARLVAAARVAESRAGPPDRTGGRGGRRPPDKSWPGASCRARRSGGPASSGRAR